MDSGRQIVATPLSPDDMSGQKEESGETIIDSPSDGSLDEKRRFSQVRDNAFARRCWEIITWTPKRCRWDPDNPPKFNMALNLLFGFVSEHGPPASSLQFSQKAN